MLRQACSFFALAQFVLPYITHRFVLWPGVYFWATFFSSLTTRELWAANDRPLIASPSSSFSRFPEVPPAHSSLTIMFRLWRSKKKISQTTLISRVESALDPCHSCDVREKEKLGASHTQLETKY